MKEYAILALMALSTTAIADPCDSKKDSGDGVPAAYYIHECKGKRALARKDAKTAAFHFRQALAVSIFEAPNYRLKVELAQALCLLGERNEAERNIDEFMCMASVDLGESECYTKDGNRNPSLSDACFSVCEGFGSSLNPKGRAAVESHRALAQQVLGICGRPNNTVEMDARKSGARPSP
jgi:hypothetical protein